VRKRGLVKKEVPVMSTEAKATGVTQKLLQQKLLAPDPAKTLK